MNFTLREGLLGWVLLSALSACGGGGDPALSAPATSAAPPPAPAPATYAVSATVTGLQGSGLTVQFNGAAPISVTNNGVLSLAPRLQAGQSYALTVATQPSGPVQSCTVGQGAGAMPAADVSGVTITCATLSPPVLTFQSHPNDAVGVDGQQGTRVDDGRQWTYTRRNGKWVVTGIAPGGRTTMFGAGGYRFGTTPYLAMGPGTDQNFQGNLCKSGPGNCNTTTMAFAALGDVNARYAGADGLPNFERTADPLHPSRPAYRLRIQHDDPCVDSHASCLDLTKPQQRKTMPRYGDSGATPATGLGAIKERGRNYVDAFSVYFPAATRARLANWEVLLLWQLKSSSDQPGVSLVHFAGAYSNYNIPQGRPWLAADPEPRLAIITQDANGVTGIQRLVPATPADQWIHIVLRTRAGVCAGDSPRVEGWYAIGDGPWQKSVDMSTSNLTNVVTDCATFQPAINTQWGWYVYTDRNLYINQQPHWVSGDALTAYWKEYVGATAARSAPDPTPDDLDDWFQVMRLR